MPKSRSSRRPTRRSALMLAAAAPDLFGQTGDKTKGHPVVHFEIGCRDLAKTSQFFSSLFGWKMNANSMSGGIDTGSSAGIGGHLTSLGHEPFHYAMFYVEVEDVKTALDKAVQLGGKAVVGPVNFPGGTFAWFNDIDGNMIGLLKPR